MVFVSEDVRVRKLNLPDATEELRLSEVGGAGKGCAAIKSRAESLRGFWLVLRLRISSSYSAMRSAVKDGNGQSKVKQEREGQKERCTYADTT